MCSSSGFNLFECCFTLPYEFRVSVQGPVSLYWRMGDGGRAGEVEKNHVLKKFLKNYSIIFSTYFASPYKSFEDIFSENLEEKKNMYKISHNFVFQRFLRYFEVCSRGDLVKFLEVCSSGVLEEISLLTISWFFLVFMK